MASLDHESCRKFNVAARWTLRQTGVVRARCEEFEPHELEAKQAITAEDPDSGETVVIEEGDAFAGLKKLLLCLEELNGKTALDRKGDLRAQFYQELKRQPHERINTFCTRFRSLVGEMRREGITIPEGELGWFLRERLGLDPIRKQLLETALAGKDSYQDVEGECLRLFRDLHSSDPLHRRFPEQRPPLLSRFLAQSQSGSSRTSLPSSSSSMTSMPRSFRSSSTSTFKFRKPGMNPPPRQSMVTENEDEHGPEEDEELVPDAPAEGTASGSASLEEVLQLEAECLAAELQEAEEEGIDEEILDGLEMGVERAAESLLTMREARLKLNDVRKDRGYGGKGGGKGASGKGQSKGRPSGNQVTARKNDPQHPCWDCGLPGHWKGDKACQKPGAGLAMPPGKSAKQVRIAEAQTAEAIHDEVVEHEVQMASCESFLPLDEALRQSHRSPNDVLSVPLPQLMADKRLVGALDSACNRTCSGDVWLKGYLRELIHAPMEIRNLIATMDENETFRFGNGGTQQSKQRWRLPIMVGQTLVCVWVSVVEVPSLGLLLGRDFLDSIGGVLSFARKLLRADHLDGSLIRLRQLVAGHFALQLLPRRWPMPGPQGWKKLGVDSVLELQVSSGEWLNRRLQASGAFSTSPSTHEHLITEHAVLAADVANSGLELDNIPTGGTPAQDMLAVLQSASNSTTSPSTRKTSSRSRTLPSRADASSRMEQGGSLGKDGHSSSNSRSMARARHVVVALAAIATALSALSISSSEQCSAVAAASRVDDSKWSPFPKARFQGREGRVLYHCQSGSLPVVSRSDGMETCIRGRPNDGRNVVGPIHKGVSTSTQATSVAGGSEGGQGGRSIRRTRSNGSSVVGASWRPSQPQRRLDKAGGIATCSSGGEGNGRAIESKDSGAFAERGRFTKEPRSGNVFSFKPGKAKSSEVSVVQSRSKSSNHDETDDGAAGCTFQTHPRPSVEQGDECSTVGRRTRIKSVSAHDRCELQVHRGNHGGSGHSRGANLYPNGPAGCDGKPKPPGSAVLGAARVGSNQLRREASFVRGPNDGDPWPQRRRVGFRLQREELKVGEFNEDKQPGPCTAPGSVEDASRDGAYQTVGEKEPPEYAADSDSDGFGNPWKLNSTIKKGQALMIAQAWDQHVADRQKISATSRQVLETMHEDWMADMEAAMNDVMVTSVEFPSPLVSEVYTNSQNILKEARRRGHVVGSALSLETGWNFLSRLDREAAKKKLGKEKPFFLVLAFPCGAWSQLLNLNPPRDLEGKQKEAKTLLMFALELAKMQKAAGRHFVLENPLTSQAWGLREVEAALLALDAGVVDFDQCAFNLRSAEGHLHKKATRMASSSEALLQKLSNHRCTKDHYHQHVIGGSRITAPAGVYPQQLAKAMVDAMEEQFVKENKTLQEILVVDGDAEIEDRPSADYESESEDEHQMADSTSQMKIPPAIRMSIKRLHDATGHRSNRRLARALVIAGAPTEAVVAAKQHRCAICDEKRAPKSRRPASLPTPRDVSDQIHIDVFDVFDSSGTKFQVIHVIDWATRFQLAQVLERRTTRSVTDFLDRHWLPIFGPPRVLVADQAREFVSWEFEAWAAKHSVLLWHIAVQAPWQNGICERAGGILKVLVHTLVKTHTVVGFQEMQTAVAESTMAYNHDVNESGVTPAQAAIGKQPRLLGDALGGFSSRLAEHGVIDQEPHVAKAFAMRESAKVAMVRLHFSRSIRRAEFARSRTSTQTAPLEPGMIVYFWREQRANSRNGPQKKRLTLRRWHGPALLIAREGNVNAYVSFKGQLTKCALEHLRPASTMEQIASETWRDAIEESVQAAQAELAHQAALQQAPSQQHVPPALGDQPQLQAQPDSLPELPASEVRPSELIGALRPALASQSGTASDGGSASVSSSGFPSRRSSLNEDEVDTRVPGTPIGGERPRRRSLSRLDSIIEQAREVDDEEAIGGQKRPAEIDAEALREMDGAEPSISAQSQAIPTELPEAPVIAVSSGESEVVQDVLVLDREEVIKLSQSHEDLHPLQKIQALAALDRLDPTTHIVQDHGTWDGRWPLPSRSTWQAHMALGLKWPVGKHEVLAVQAARREYFWRNMTDVQREAFKPAAEKGWLVWTDNQALEELSVEESKKVMDSLRTRGELHRVLRPRYVYTDKHDGLRTENHRLPISASARLVVPGFRDIDGYTVRKDAPTVSRLSQHMILTYAACLHKSQGWRLRSADIKSAFMKGEFFDVGERELYIENIKPQHPGEPTLPLKPGVLCRLRKGIFGLADSPRRWYLRLHKSLDKLGWKRSMIDLALWYLWDDTGTKLEGVIGSHVDDLLFAGNSRASKLLDQLGEELGFGSLEENTFHYCGKHIAQQSDGTIVVSMVEYHQNLKPVMMSAERKKQVDGVLTTTEHRQLRAVLGSLQWLVAQIRYDLAFPLSVLQSEKPTVMTMLKANALVKKFKQHPNFAIYFRPFDLTGSGLMVVTDSSLGNVRQDGTEEGSPLERTFSQSSYMVLLGDKQLMNGEVGNFSVLDARSHRISRVCRSTYAAELLGCEEAVDVGLFTRGIVAEFHGFPVLARNIDQVLEVIPLTIVIDAKDVYDRGMSDTSSFGSQKSLAFSVAWLRAQLRRANTCLRWTSTANMFVDAGTKNMDVSHLHGILEKCQWSAKYSPAFVKQGKSLAIRKSPSKSLKKLGEPVPASDPMLAHLMTLTDQTGWHNKAGLAIQVSRNAKSFRQPGPRYDSSRFSLRSSYARYDDPDGSAEWRCLERDVKFADLAKPQGLIGDEVAVLVTIFRDPSLIQQKKEAAVNAALDHG